jgi:hypothetical protein
METLALAYAENKYCILLYFKIVNPQLLVLNEILTIQKMHIYIPRSNETTYLIDTFI